MKLTAAVKSFEVHRSLFNESSKKNTSNQLKFHDNLTNSYKIRTSTTFNGRKPKI